MGNRLGVDDDALASFCSRWKIRRMELFGSALRSDFDEESDVDVLVTFDESAEWSLFDHVRMEREFEAIVDRPVDIVNRRVIERSDNPVRRRAILDRTEPLYAAG